MIKYMSKNISRNILRIAFVGCVVSLCLKFNGFDAIVSTYHFLHSHLHQFTESLPLITSITGTIIALFILFYVIRPHIIMYPYFTRDLDINGKRHYQFLVVNKGIWPTINVQMKAKEILDESANTVDPIKLNCECLPILHGLLGNSKDKYVSFGYEETERMQEEKTRQIELEVIASHPISNVTKVCNKTFYLSNVVDGAYFKNGKIINGPWYCSIEINLCKMSVFIEYILLIMILLLVGTKLFSLANYYMLFNKILIYSVLAWASISFIIQGFEIWREWKSYKYMNSNNNK